jgi:hypothetical protein
MGYEDALYSARNIIGYTGEINDSPTVYFLEPLGTAPRRYGHITQAHWLWLNTGRECAHSAENYTYENNIDGVLVEKVNGKILHTSRNRFIPTSPGRTQTDLEKSITRFTGMKSIYEPQYYNLVQKYLFGAESDDDFDKALRKAWGGPEYQGDVAAVWSQAFITPRRR